MRSANAQKLKGEETIPQMNKKRQIYSKIRVHQKLKGRAIWGCTKIRGAKIKGAKFRVARILMGIRYLQISLPIVFTSLHFFTGVFQKFWITDIFIFPAGFHRPPAVTCITAYLRTNNKSYSVLQNTIGNNVRQR